MAYDVVVVGGGIGGLTVGALLSARGVSTCVLERQSQVGGCIGRVELAGYDFEPGMGLYPAWAQGEIFDQIFSELTVPPPEASRLQEDYVVRLYPGADIPLKQDDLDFFDELRKSFPECAQTAIEFYQVMNGRAAKSRDHERHEAKPGILRRVLSSLRSEEVTSSIDNGEPILSLLSTSSSRFQRFIDAQLNAFLQTSINDCAIGPASAALTLPRRNLYSLTGGQAALAERLAEAIKAAGGVVRLNSPVLRLAYDESNKAVGVDLLSGERVGAKQAIISNLTIWDTYGRLVGTTRTPSETKNRLAKLESSGAFVIYAVMDKSVVSRLPASRFLVCGSEMASDEIVGGDFTFAISTAGDGEKCGVTIQTKTEVEQWFAFQTSEEDYEERDRAALELLWSRVHTAVPELGSAIEVIETANPRTYYDQARRKLGKVLGIKQSVMSSAVPADGKISQFDSPIPNLFMVSDTTSSGFGIESVARSALQLANQITK